VKILGAATMLSFHIGSAWPFVLPNVAGLNFGDGTSEEVGTVHEARFESHRIDTVLCVERLLVSGSAPPDMQ